MKLEDQVCSLELAKRLKDLGVKQEAIVEWLKIPFKYILNEDGTLKEILYEYKLGNRFACNIEEKDSWSAFSVAGLGEYLQWEKLYIFDIPKELLDYVDGENTEADARAKMMIYMIENNLAIPQS
jgi:hypothetical protein